MTSRPLDARLARWMVQPLRDTSVTPSQLTTVRLAVGVAAAAAFAAGLSWANTGAWLFVLSNLLDHTDGELARMTGTMTRFGHRYDLAADIAVHALVFFGIGVGLHDRWDGAWEAPLGALAGLSVSGIFWLRIAIERRIGRTAAALPSTGWFEIEDVLYLLPVITGLGLLPAFLVAAVIGAPLFAVALAIWSLALAPATRAEPAPAPTPPPASPAERTPR